MKPGPIPPATAEHTKRCGVPFPMVMGDGWVVRCERDTGHAADHRGMIVDLSDPFVPDDILYWARD